ncbi:olfactory receptor 2D2-like [Tiliqua scincoides]|uniref:olfactory receptor 2D2-like n=1 Tax=Tiliqua scincoides TaxID=71010 RepID=UPI003463436A
MQEKTWTENHTTITHVILLGLTSHRRAQVALFVVILIAYLITMVSNLLIIMLVQSDSRLHTPMYFFLSNFSGVEICFVTSMVPQMLVHLLSGSGRISFNHCIAQMYIVSALGCTEGLLLGAMACDRYLAICCPLVYPTAMSRKRSLMMAVASWAGACLLSGVTTASILRLPFCGPNRIDHFICDFIMVIKLACTNAQLVELTILVFVTFILLIPFLATLTSYGLILTAVMRMRSSAGRNKAFSTCASHLLVVTLFYGTIIILYMRPQSNSANNKYVTTFYVIFTPLLNPIIYTLRNKDIHAAVSKVLHGVDTGRKS